MEKTPFGIRDSKNQKMNSRLAYDKIDGNLGVKARRIHGQIIGFPSHNRWFNFFENFEEEKEKLSKKLNVKLNCNHNFDLNHTKKNLYKYKKNLSNDEID